MKKVHTAVAKHLQDMIARKYNLIVDMRSAEGMAKAMINTYNQTAETALKGKKGRFLDQTLDAYWLTTKLPKREKRNHSAYWYKQYLRQRYYILPVPKNRFTRWILKKLNIL